MTDKSLDLFREEVTSGAFSLSLSRAQIAALSMIAEVGDSDHGGHTYNALFRKGLITHVQSETGRLEYRLTTAGVYALKLAVLADLTNGRPDPVEAELTALHNFLNIAREAEQRARQDAWNMTARVKRAYLAIARARAWVHGGALPKRPMVMKKDKEPRRTQAEIIADLQSAESLLQVDDQ